MCPSHVPEESHDFGSEGLLGWCWCTVRRRWPPVFFSFAWALYCASFAHPCFRPHHVPLSSLTHSLLHFTSFHSINQIVISVARLFIAISQLQSVLLSVLVHCKPSTATISTRPDPLRRKLNLRDFSHTQPHSKVNLSSASAFAISSLNSPHKTFKMSGRLDQSLDSIIDSQKKAKREARRRKVGKSTGATAPVGGVKKATKPVKSAIKPAAGSTAQARSSKIVVSGLV